MDKEKIKVTSADIGKKVIYRQAWMQPENFEHGVITNFNDSYVFVRYGHETQSKSTRYDDLVYEDVKVEPKPTYWKDLWHSYGYFLKLFLESIVECINQLFNIIGYLLCLVLLPCMELARYWKEKPFWIKLRFQHRLSHLKKISSLETTKNLLDHYQSDPLYTWSIQQIDQRIRKLQIQGKD
jgi:hypothetical protein